MKKSGANSDIIYPVQIPIPFAVGNVWSYLLKDEKTVLVDCGHKSDEAYTCIQEGLSEAGVLIKDLDEIWLTHGHPDHFGQAASLAEESGAVVCGHTKERSNFEGDGDSRLFEAFFKKQGIPAEQVNYMNEQLAWLHKFQEPVRPEWIEDGRIVSSGKLSFTVCHAPGHLIFRSDQGLIFGGDVLLEHISTNALINFDPDTGERNMSLLQYRNSLKRIRKLKGQVLPGHGRQVDRIRETADHHLDEQRRRYTSIQNLLQQSGRGRTLFELALATFPKALKNGAIFLVL